MYEYGELKKVLQLSVQKQYLPVRGERTTPFYGWQYRAEDGHMRNFRSTNPHGTVFAPKQCLYQKEATGIESSKMYCPSRCRNSSYQCETANYPVSWVAVYSREWKFAKFRAYQSLWYRICTKAMVISKRSYGYGELKNILPYTVQKQYLPVRGRKLPRFMGVTIDPRMEICDISGLPIPVVPRSHQSNAYIK